eukprot:jgi/Picsp_1/253/NSC_00252-R1_protease do-like chloroplastic-like
MFRWKGADGFSRPSGCCCPKIGQRSCCIALRQASIRQFVDTSLRQDRLIDVVLEKSADWAIATVLSLSLIVSLPAMAEETPSIVPVSLSSEEQHVAEIFERCNKSVVNIFDATVAGRIAVRSNSLDIPEGNGSGFVFDSAGHIVSNYHVLGKALDALGSRAKQGYDKPIAKVLVVGPDGGASAQKSYDGVLVGFDKERDLVVLKIDAAPGDLVPLKLGDSSLVKVGDTVLAIGNPFGFDHTLTKGIISYVGRGFQSQTGSTIGGGIQTDAAINPGNSGGPLISLQGDAIGVNTAIFSNTGVSARIGFAIPSNTVAKSVPQIIAKGSVSRPSLGIGPASDPIAKGFNITDGVLIQTVDKNGPADLAGLLPTRRAITGIVPGDIIVALNDNPIHSVFDLSSVLDQISSDEAVKITYIRKTSESDPGTSTTLVLKLKTTLNEFTALK